MTISATHGVEGFCGSGLQVDWLARKGPAALPGDTAALFVHAINPYGFAWLRRVTDEGNDLNRNYVDHGKPYPENPGYIEIADALVPPSLSGPEFEAGRGEAEGLPGEGGRRRLSSRHVRWAIQRTLTVFLRWWRAVVVEPHDPRHHRPGIWPERQRHRRHRFPYRPGPFGYGEMITHYDPDSDRLEPRARLLAVSW